MGGGGGDPSYAVEWYSLHGWRCCRGWWRQAWCLRIALGSRHRSILKQIVRLPEKVLAVVLEPLVQQSQQENGYHGTNKTRHRLDMPPGEQNCLIVAKVELQKAQQDVIKETKGCGKGNYQGCLQLTAIDIMCSMPVPVPPPPCWCMWCMPMPRSSCGVTSGGLSVVESRLAVCSWLWCMAAWSWSCMEWSVSHVKMEQ